MQNEPAHDTIPEDQRLTIRPAQRRIVVSHVPIWDRRWFRSLSIVAISFFVLGMLSTAVVLTVRVATGGMSISEFLGTNTPTITATSSLTPSSTPTREPTPTASRIPLGVSNPVLVRPFPALDREPLVDPLDRRAACIPTICPGVEPGDELFFCWNGEAEILGSIGIASEFVSGQAYNTRLLCVEVIMIDPDTVDLSHAPIGINADLWYSLTAFDYPAIIGSLYFQNIPAHGLLLHPVTALTPSPTPSSTPQGSD